MWPSCLHLLHLLFALCAAPGASMLFRKRLTLGRPGITFIGGGQQIVHRPALFGGFNCDEAVTVGFLVRCSRMVVGGQRRGYDLQGMGESDEVSAREATSVGV